MKWIAILCIFCILAILGSIACLVFQLSKTVEYELYVDPPESISGLEIRKVKIINKRIGEWEDWYATEEEIKRFIKKYNNNTYRYKIEVCWINEKFSMKNSRE